MAGQLTIDTLRASSGVLATQNGMTGIAKAWVTFNGSTATIYGGAGVGSFNVGSITKNGTGDYTVNFTTAMPSTNYATLVTTGTSATADANCPQVRTDLCTTSSARVYMKGTNAAFFDVNLYNVAILSS